MPKLEHIVGQVETSFQLSGLRADNPTCRNLGPLPLIRLDMEDPHWRSELQLKDMRSFRIAALKMQANPERMVRACIAAVWLH